MNALKHIFTESDKVFSCDLNSEGGTFRTQICQPDNIQPRNFFCINPIRGQRRLKDQIAAYRNFLFESDTMPIADQYLLANDLKQSGLVSMATFSGTKSIHFVVSAADNLNLGEPGSDAANERYKRIWLGLAKQLQELGLSGIDQSNKNPVTLSRMPGAMRGEVEQSLLYTGPLQTSDFLYTIALPERQQELRPTSNVNSFLELEEVLKKRKHEKLRMAIQHPGTYINNHNGNYPLLFRYAAWLIDETNAPLDAALSYFEKYFVPHLHAKAYFKDWKKPIIGAYRHKGVL